MRWAFCVLGWAGLVGGACGRPVEAMRADRARQPSPVVRIVNLHSGQVVEAGGGRTLARGSVPRGLGTVFDTMTNEASTTGLNLAYSDPASYRGESASTQAFAVSMAERLVYRAPSDPGAGFPLPTDILWNEYACDMSRWPGGAACELASFGVIPYFQNTEPPVQARTHTLVVRFFREDLVSETGAFSATFRVSPGQTGYFATHIDLTSLDPAVLAPSRGWVMLDWAEANNSGVGCMFTGGDLVNTLYPRPESLWAAGTSDPDNWRFCDGVTGIGGPPALVDPAWDGVPGSTSYLDIANTGAMADWQFTAGGSPPVNTLAHDVAWSMEVAGAPACPCDINGTGTLDSQDFFAFVIGFFEGDADFNGSGTTDSQDFFAFLICFFGGCGP
jgi:hypothetical protein